MSEQRPVPAPRSIFNLFYDLSTRWADNDMYGHVNNVVFYAYFDTVVNRYLIEEGGMRPGVDPVVGYVVSSSANYFASIAHPAEIVCGLRVVRLGAKSCTWEIGVFLENDEESRVTGRFTHAFVDTTTGASAEIPEPLRRVLQKLT
ncbi:thioesterase family protein [Luminiphilus syltensis NOR5-1B]|uniref:Thioesterase family protein n=1 Tax=Luminiphilus syltensis NOR5-1B TaxID=565045 RepID=B8KS16_9GAMM|nr:thioesterase family protein [Luminiphilus syltensis]EED36274.1 thioesterase family protein [Luminiphilus syltensis NOR5-1B]